MHCSAVSTTSWSSISDQDRIKLVLHAKLAGVKKGKIRWTDAAKAARGLSFADVVRAAEDAIKAAVVDEREIVAHADLMSAIRERRSAATGREVTG